MTEQVAKSEYHLSDGKNTNFFRQNMSLITNLIAGLIYIVGFYSPIWANELKSIGIFEEQNNLEFLQSLEGKFNLLDLYGNQEFDKKTHLNYLAHEDINNLRGLEVELIFKWKIGDLLIFDRSHLHCSSKNINKKKLGFTSSTKKI